MRPIEFSEANTTFGKDQPQYLSLPAWKNESEIATCWRGTWRDRLRFLFAGKMWVRVLTFGKPPQPLNLLTYYPFVKD